MDDTTVPTGDPLLEAAAIEYPWLTVIPIYLQMEEPDAGSTATPRQPLGEGLDVSCLGTEISLGSDRSQPDRWAWPSSSKPRNSPCRRPASSSTVRVPAETGTSVLAAPSGHPHHPMPLRTAISEVGTVSFEVEDTEGYWTDPSVDCAPPDSIEEATPVTGPTSWEDMLVWATLPENLPDGFPIVRARFVGYPESDPTRTIGMFLDPDDQLIRRVNVVRLGPDEWTVETVTCPIT